MKTWQLQEAKNKFSEVVDEALAHGPQLITRRGTETVVIISVNDYKQLKKPQTSFIEFMRNSPLAGLELDMERNKDTGREVKL